MGWNTSALFVQGQDPLTLVATPVVPTGRVVDAFEATGGLPHEYCFTAQTGDWHELWDPSLLHVLSMPTPIGPRALSVVFASVSSSYGFSYYDGATLARQIVYADGEPVMDTGTPLSIEDEITFPSWGPDEDFIWAVINAVTGLGFDEARRYTVHQFS